MSKLRPHPLGIPEAAGYQLRAELGNTHGMGPRARAVGLVLAARMCAHGGRAYGGVVGIQRRVEAVHGFTVSRRQVRYALAMLRREGYVRVRCPKHGDQCRGGRRQDGGGHAATYVRGPRQLGRTGSRRGWRRVAPLKGAISCTPPPLYGERDSYEKERSGVPPGLSTGRGDAERPERRKPAAAPPREGPGEAGGPTRLRDLLPPLPLPG